MQTPPEPKARCAQSAVHQQVADALQSKRLPISQLLRLLWALDADPSVVNQSLRAELRKRVCAPINA